MLYHNHIASTTDKTLGLCPYSSFMKINQHSCRNRFFFMSSTVLQVSKDSQIQCLFSGAAAFIGEGIDFTHTHVGHWKAMSCEECQQNFRFERYIDSFSEQWFHCSPERCDIGEVSVKNLCWMIFTPIVCLLEIMLVIRADWSIVTQIFYNETLPAIITVADDYKCVLPKHMLTISYFASMKKWFLAILLLCRGII